MSAGLLHGRALALRNNIQRAGDCDLIYTQLRVEGDLEEPSISDERRRCVEAKLYVIRRELRLRPALIPLTLASELRR